MALPRPVLGLLILAVAFAPGCLKRPSEEAPPVDVQNNTTMAQNATLPDGRGESAGLLETNKTEEGVGGVEHKHDYWKGKDKVVLFDEDITLFCPPCMPDGEGTQPKSVAYVKLDTLPDSEEDALVYEGSDHVELLFGAPMAADGTPHPSPPALFVQWRSAADSEWTSPAAVTYDQPISIDVDEQMTDMPHSTHSLWVFRVTTDRPEASLTTHMTFTTFKGREVVDWPGHPDFYADKSERVVMQQHVTTHMSGIESFALYDSGGTWASPERLISWGTKEVVIFINVTKTTNQLGAPATGYFLEAHNATIIGPEITFGSRHNDVNGNNDLQSYQFNLLVTEDGMDGPYQPASRWGFRMMATFADIDGVIGFCPGCFPYDIEYDITVLALNHETGQGEEMEAL